MLRKQELAKAAELARKTTLDEKAASIPYDVVAMESELYTGEAGRKLNHADSLSATISRNNSIARQAKKRPELRPGIVANPVSDGAGDKRDNDRHGAEQEQLAGPLSDDDDEETKIAMSEEKVTRQLVSDLESLQMVFNELARQVGGLISVSYTHLTLPTIYSV